MAKLQIKSEKPLLLEDFFSGRGANPLTLTVQNSATLLLREKRVKEKVYIYKYIINISLLFCSFTGGRRGVRKIGLSVSARRHIKARS